HPADATHMRPTVGHSGDLALELEPNCGPESAGDFATEIAHGICESGSPISRPSTRLISIRR
ncbi:MAG: hypothetical protein ABL921_27820, partial [Pirellula sp.]